MKKIAKLSLDRVDELRLHLQDVHSTDNNGNYLRPVSERTLVTEACFLKLFVTFEEFLESSFVHYLTGRMSTNRWRPSKFAKPQSDEHAHGMIKGMKPFVDWSTPDTVKSLAELYFESGEPFKTPLSGAHDHLAKMKTVRNSTAHVSKTTRTKLNSLYLTWTGQPTSGVTAYEMLIAVENGQGHTFYSASEQKVQQVIALIANR